MMRSVGSRHSGTRRRGAVAVFVVVVSVVIVGFAALVIDVGMLYAAKADLQRAADAAALAGLSAYISDNTLLNNNAGVQQAATSRVQQIGLANATLSSATAVELADIALGRHDFSDPLAALGSTGQWNAVEVTTRRTADSANGPVPFFFARIWGYNSGDVTATARAAVDDRFRGVNATLGPPLLPITIDVDEYNSQLSSGNDEFSYDGTWIVSSGDGIDEIHIFPEKVKKKDEEGDGAGNFGLLNIDGNGNAVQVSTQIQNNISPEELINEFGTAEIVYYDSDGNPITYSINGTTGLKATIEFELQQRIGQVVGFFIHDGVTGQGSNTYFNNVGIRFGRLMYAELNGGDKKVVVQPAVYAGDSIIVGDGAPSSDGLVVEIQLVK